ncbi:hypothetical protein ACFO9E_25480 [Streptomyces maoxianensis]|uniref:ATP-binding protein n=1 Tax=Streptomyces maoxianensis TaxID=1459942 RepID=A0ABV9G9Z1_9ACTN
MSVPVAPKPHRIRTPWQLPLTTPLTALVVPAAIGGAVITAAPDTARAWVVGTVSAAWLGLAVTVVAAALSSRRLREAAAVAHGELCSLRGQLAQAADELERVTTVTLPAAAARLRRGASAATVLAELEQPTDARLRVLLDAAVRELAVDERRSAAARAGQPAREPDAPPPSGTGTGTAIPSQGGPRVATAGRLPVRPPGRTMAAAERGRTRSAAPDAVHDSTGRDAGAQFGAFHRSLRTAPSGPPVPPHENVETGGTGG